MIRRTLVGIVMLAALAASSRTSDAAPITLGFNGLAAGAFNGYSQDGFTVNPFTGTWLTNTSYGAPSPFPYFTGPGYLQPAVSASLEITGGGGLFTFASVDLYSIVTPIPWRFTGFLNGAQVFDGSGQLGNTLGLFKNVVNPSALAAIDRLVITLTNPINLSCPTCGANPMGPDNIVVQRVPEPASLLLLGPALAAAAWRRARSRRG